METRKVQKVSGGTYTVSIPIDWAKEYDLEAGVPVYLYTHLDGSLVLRRAEKESSDLATVEIELEGSDPLVAERMLRAGYSAGFQRITFTSPTRFTSEQRNALNEGARNLTGVEIVDESDACVTTQGLLDPSDVSIRQSVLQLRFITLSMHEAAMAALTGDASEVEYIRQRDDEADRIFELVTRHFNRSLTDLEEIDQLGVSRPKLFAYFLMARQLERIADHAVKLAGVVHRTDRTVPDELRDEIAAIGGQSRTIVKDASDAVIDGAAVESAHSALDLRDEVIERGDAMTQLLVEESPPETYALAHVVDSLIRTARYGGNIAEIAIQTSLRTE